MTSRAEISSRHGKAYERVSKKDKGPVLDEVVSVTGWSRDNARFRLTCAPWPCSQADLRPSLLVHTHVLG
jgi:hypothetical protein